jgi:tetrahydromethanopterin S-methyltransferase subunit F
MLKMAMETLTLCKDGKQMTDYVLKLALATMWTFILGLICGFVARVFMFGWGLVY